ncbi:hypothetical protein V6N11_053760 [Hibiscus sabdariffa]|uniref:RNase H type-1 domain-containing protein n=1 Tax=Hibiscus sabdariffa TaxID=183260 RepID=A0ABR2S2S4_9ROSI
MGNECIFENKKVSAKDLLFNTKMRALVWVKAAKGDSIENVDAWWDNPVECQEVAGESVGCGGVLRISDGTLRALFFGPLHCSGYNFAELLAMKLAVDVFIEAGWVGVMELVLEYNS